MFNTNTARGRLLLIDPARGEEKLRENSSSMTTWWQWSSWFSGRASPSTTEEEEVLEEGEGYSRGRVRLPSLSLTIYRGKEGGGGALGFPRGGAAATGETLDGFGRPYPLGNLPPKPGGVAVLGEAPPPLHVRGDGVGGAHSPLVG